MFFSPSPSRVRVMYSIVDDQIIIKKLMKNMQNTSYMIELELEYKEILEIFETLSKPRTLDFLSTTKTSIKNK